MRWNRERRSWDNLLDTAKGDAGRLTREAIALLGAKEYEKAQKILEKSIQVDPACAPAYFVLGETFRLAGKPVHAWHFVKRGMTTGWIFLWPLLSAGIAYWKMAGLINLAFTHIRQAVSMSPNNVPALCVVAMLEAERGDVITGLTLIESAMFFAPLDPDARRFWRAIKSKASGEAVCLDSEIHEIQARSYIDI